MTDDTLDKTTTRRTVMATAVSVLGLSALTGQVSAQSGDVGTAADPYKKAFVNVVNLKPRTSDITGYPEDGTIWYRSDVS